MLFRLPSVANSRTMLIALHTLTVSNTAKDWSFIHLLCSLVETPINSAWSVDKSNNRHIFPQQFTRSQLPGINLKIKNHKLLLANDLKPSVANLLLNYLTDCRSTTLTKEGSPNLVGIHFYTEKSICSLSSKWGDSCS